MIVRAVLTALGVGLLWYLYLVVPANRSSLAGTTGKSVDHDSYHRELGLSVSEKVFLADGRYSHLLLPDSRYSVSAFDKKSHDADLAKIVRLFPDANQRKEVLEWGRMLFEACRQRYYFQYLKRKTYYDTQPAGVKERKALEAVFAVPATDGLKAHAAWQRLTCAPGVKGDDLFRLQEMFQASVPQEADRASLLKWSAFRRLQRFHQRNFNVGKEEIQSIVRPLVPNTLWFLTWIAYEDWTVTSQVFEAKKADFLGCVGANSTNQNAKWQAVLELGKNYTEQRRRAGDQSLPAFSDKTALIAVIDRLSGLDPAIGPRIDKTNEKFVEFTESGNGVRAIPRDNDVRPQMWLEFLFNAEDAMMVADSTLANTTLTPYRLKDVPFPTPEEVVTTPRRGLARMGFLNQMMAAFLICLPFSWIALSAVRFVTTDVPGTVLLLFLDSRYRRWVGGFDVYGFGQVLAWYFLAWLGIWLAPYTPGNDGRLKVLLANDTNNNLIVYLFMITFSSILTEGINNVVVVVFFRLGMNPFGSSGWIANVASSIASAFVQLIFGVPMMAILIGTAIGNLAPSLFLQLTRTFAGGNNRGNDSDSHPSRFGSCGCSVLTVLIFLGLLLVDRLHSARNRIPENAQPTTTPNELVIRPTAQQPYWWRANRP